MPTLLSHNKINYLPNVWSQMAISIVVLATPTLQNWGKSVYPYITALASATGESPHRPRRGRGGLSPPAGAKPPQKLQFLTLNLPKASSTP